MNLAQLRHTRTAQRLMAYLAWKCKPYDAFYHVVRRLSCINPMTHVENWNTVRFYQFRVSETNSHNAKVVLKTCKYNIRDYLIVVNSH